MLVVINTTVANKKDAKNLARMLIESKLSACVQISKIKSFYPWQNKIRKDKEFLLSIKSKSENVDKILKQLKEKHSYELPEFVVFEIKESSVEYEKWLFDCM
ncbi:divalent-cation tolerance protein CutA [uncultured Campylobacter sp.]|uniref:divalent-cation tolerance protein CutA n=1 Tax=uncultured Campylobacter sp. TaxID=218934 RepID=UPI002625C87A|nr:divalent-cation tolerance protein CutA [uncultured Campylobacter sp.]